MCQGPSCCPRRRGEDEKSGKPSCLTDIKGVTGERGGADEGEQDESMLQDVDEVSLMVVSVEREKRCRRGL